MAKRKRERCWDKVHRLEKELEEAQKQVDEMKGKVEKIEKERDEYLDDARRSRADYDNLTKRIDKIIRDKDRYGDPTELKNLVALYEDFNRAVDQMDKTLKQSDKIKEGMVLIKRNFQAYMEKRGISIMEAEGKPFDPDFHEAMMTVVDQDHEEHTVLRVLQNGYMIHDKVLIPAKVVVSKKGKENKEE